MPLENLLQALHTLNAEDALRARLDHAQWRMLASYLTQRLLKRGEVLIEMGEMDRVMYLVESGTLQVYVPVSASAAAAARRPVAILRAGAVAGEPALFGETPRMAQVEAMSPSVVWALSRARMEEFAQQQPDIAFELLRACGAVMAVRMRANLERGLPSA